MVLYMGMIMVAVNRMSNHVCPVQIHVDSQDTEYDSPLSTAAKTQSNQHHPQSMMICMVDRITPHCQQIHLSRSVVVTLPVTVSLDESQSCYQLPCRVTPVSVELMARTGIKLFGDRSESFISKISQECQNHYITTKSSMIRIFYLYT